MMKIKTIITSTAFVAVLFSTPSYAQDDRSVEQTAKLLTTAVGETTRTRTGQLKEIVKWQKKQDEYKALQDSVNAVGSVLVSKSDDLKKRKKRHDDLTNKMSGLYMADNAKRRTDNEMYGSYDIFTLSLHQGHLGDKAAERRMDALLACHKAEALLAKRFDKANVENARKQIADVKEVAADVFNRLDDRLSKYEAVSKALKSALEKAAKGCPKQDENLSSYAIEEYGKEFFTAVISDDIKRLIVEPSLYPYLYEAIMEALDAKMNDPRSDISKIIDRL